MPLTYFQVSNRDVKHTEWCFSGTDSTSDSNTTANQDVGSKSWGKTETVFLGEENVIDSPLKNNTISLNLSSQF